MSLRKSVLSIAALSLAFAGGAIASRVSERNETLRAEGNPALAEQGTATPTRTAAPLRASALPDLSDVAEQAVRASVNISSTQPVQVQDPLMRFFYGNDAVQSQTSLGSGVIIDPDGYILTNSHVVGTRSAQVRVTMPDNRELPAEIRGIDRYTDLAVLKIDAKGLTPLPFGDSSKLRAAEWVLAVGNPFAFNQTVTLGIVSAPNRHDPQLATYNDFIQTDAAINPGNSGGALVNSRGELVGINTMIYSETGQYAGIGFAIPANLARRVMTALIKDGQIERGWIGNLTLYTVTAEQAKRAGLGDKGGAFVYTFYRNDPVALSGLQPRDIITRFNTTTVTEQSQLQRLIADAPIGTTAKLEVMRQGVARTIEVPIQRASQAPPARR